MWIFYPKKYRLTTEELILGCKRKDPVAQRQVYTVYSGRMFGICVRYAKNYADAEDIMQESFMKIFDKIHQFKNEGSFEGWIKRIVVNTALKKYSLLRYEKEITHPDLTLLEQNQYCDASAYSSLTEKELLKLIHELPDGYRLIFNLNVIEGFKHDEIANMLGIQPVTSRTQLAKARNMLQKRIMDLQKIAV
jgi:RNA polymerase sigma-70 factor (ECF subfamily)